eukprot:1157323-Pelagomonas_calceolata.AAC.2
MQPHAANRSRTLFVMGCPKRKHEVVNGLPEKLCYCHCSHLLPHPACIGPRLLPLVQALPAPKVMWVELLPSKHPGREEGVSMRLHYTHQEAAQGERGRGRDTRETEGAGGGARVRWRSLRTHHMKRWWKGISRDQKSVRDTYCEMQKRRSLQIVWRTSQPFMITRKLM